MSRCQSLFSLSDLRILTTNRCSHYQSFKDELPIAVLTTRSSNSHYQSLFSLPDLRILTSNPCSHDKILHSHYQSLFSPPDLGILTINPCFYQIFEFSLPITVLIARSSNSHYQSLFSLPDVRILTTNLCVSLPDLGILTTNPCSHYQIFEFTTNPCSQYQIFFLYQIFEFSLPISVLTTRSSNSHYSSVAVNWRLT